MRITTPLRRTAGVAAALGAAGALVAGCGGSSSGALSTVTNAGATGKATTNAAAGATTGGSGGSMGAMNMGSQATQSGKATAVNGIKPIPTQTLASTTWQGMSIKAMAMTAIPFVVFDGTRERMMKVPKHASFHLMVMLDDAQSHYPIPYSTVWATFRKNGKVVYDERQWPMISKYLGPHYGNDVSLPGAGRYQVTLLISPPVSARHVEYKNVWLKPHRVNLTFNWNPKS